MEYFNINKILAHKHKFDQPVREEEQNKNDYMKSSNLKLFTERRWLHYSNWSIWSSTNAIRPQWYRPSDNLDIFFSFLLMNWTVILLTSGWSYSLDEHVNIIKMLGYGSRIEKKF